MEFLLLTGLLASFLTQPAPDTGGVSPSSRPAKEARWLAEGGNETKGFDMAPETRLEVVESAVAAIPAALPAGPFQPDWESLRANYTVPSWFNEAKFGLFMHWGVYAVPAYHNEWYEKHMYGALRRWHADQFGSPAVFGYKDFIPLFTNERFNAKEWAELFRKSGARYVMPTAQHHDNFALWDSAVTRFNAKLMGPKRDLIGELAQAVRAEGLKFGVSNHGIENFQFINPSAELLAELKAKNADLFDPEWKAFYNVADRSDAACKNFLVDWALRNVELIDKYQPDLLWFDNGVDMRYLDPLKLWVAAYYYNRAAEWGKGVSLSTKKAAYAPSGTNLETIGSIIDFEKIGGRSPAGIRAGAWQVDEPIGSTWGYTKKMTVASADVIIFKLADTVSRGGNLLLNLSPMADGTLPKEQQETLLAVGKWLNVNGEAIYGTHPYTTFGETSSRESKAPRIRYTVKGDAVYAIVLGKRSGPAIEMPSLGVAAGKVERVTILGSEAAATFKQLEDRLVVELGERHTPAEALTLKIYGLKIPKSTWTRSGNPGAAQPPIP